MKNKIFPLFFNLAILILSQQLLALEFFYDNYSKIPLLHYSFSFDGNTWQTGDSKLALMPKTTRAMEFATIPTAWRITTAEGKHITCRDVFTKKPCQNIVTLSNPDFAKNDQLLLDIIDYDTNEILIRIIDIDGNKSYSNTISCLLE